MLGSGLRAPGKEQRSYGTFGVGWFVFLKLKSKWTKMQFRGCHKTRKKEYNSNIID